VPGSEEAAAASEIEMCGCCATKKKPSYKKRFYTCCSSIIDGVCIINRACTNCAFNSRLAAYSFYKSSLIAS
jgi:hypothetical protein